MCSIMYRSFADNFGIKWPNDWAYTINRKPITWAEVLDERRAQQRRRLADIHRPESPEMQPAYLWTFCVPGWLYGGWWCYLVTKRQKFSIGSRKNTTHANIDNERIVTELMTRIPCGVLPLPENFHLWMPAFAETYPRKNVKDPRPAGSLIGWFDKENLSFYPGRTKPNSPGV